MLTCHLEKRSSESLFSCYNKNIFVPRMRISIKSFTVVLNELVPIQFKRLSFLKTWFNLPPNNECLLSRLSFKRLALQPCKTHSRLGLKIEMFLSRNTIWQRSKVFEHRHLSAAVRAILEGKEQRVGFGENIEAVRN